MAVIDDFYMDKVHFIIHDDYMPRSEEEKKKAWDAVWKVANDGYMPEKIVHNDTPGMAYTGTRSIMTNNSHGRSTA